MPANAACRLEGELHFSSANMHIRNTITGIYVYINYNMDINFSGLFFFFMYYVDFFSFLNI